MPQTADVTTAWTTAQAILILGGLVNLLVSILVAYFLYWQRVREPLLPAPRYGLNAHKVSLWNGFLLLGLSVVMPFTGFTAAVNTALAAAQVLGTLLSDLSNVHRWRIGLTDQFAEGPPWRVRLVGTAHLIDLVVISALLYGVARTALGLW
jgi:hypothetical protein